MRLRNICLEGMLLVFIICSAQLALAVECSLDVYGNANLDDSIDQKDIEYIQGIISGNKTPTYLADANNDNVIDQKDIDQVTAIIAGDEKQLTILDGLNRTVTLDMPIKTVIVTEDKLGEVMQILGVDDKVVGIDPNIAQLGGLFPVMKDKTSIGNCGFGELDYEKIATIKPDLVLIHAHYSCGTGGLSSSCVEPLEKIGTKVIAVDNFFGAGSVESGKHVNAKKLNLTIDPQSKCFRMLGMLFNKEERAREFVDWRNTLLEDLISRTDDLGPKEAKRAFMGMHSLALPIRSVGEDRKEIIPLEMAGLEIVDKASGMHEIDPECVIKNNPQYIFITGWSNQTGDYTTDSTEGFDEIIGTIRSMTMFNGTDAVKNGNIYVLAGECTDIRVWIAVSYVGKAVYPERFNDIDPDAIVKDYFENWMGVPSKGIYFYP